MKTKLHSLLLATLTIAGFVGCAGPEARHDARVDRRFDRVDNRDDRQTDRVDNRYDRRVDRHERVQQRYSY